MKYQAKSKHGECLREAASAEVHRHADGMRDEPETSATCSIERNRASLRQLGNERECYSIRLLFMPGNAENRRGIH